MKENLSLEDIVKMQYSLQERMGWKTGFGIDGFRNNILACHVELTEALNEVPWKLWKVYDKDRYLFNKDRCATELTDVLQFLINSAICIGLTHSDLSLALQKKWIENDKRINLGEVHVAENEVK